MTFASRADVAQEVFDWQYPDGLPGAIGAGVTASQMPDSELRQAWSEMQFLFEQYLVKAAVVETILEDAYEC